MTVPGPELPESALFVAIWENHSFTQLIRSLDAVLID